jgi:hypothetical protein
MAHVKNPQLTLVLITKILKFRVILKRHHTLTSEWGQNVLATRTELNAEIA